MMKHLLVATVIAILYFVSPALAQDPVGHCYLYGEKLEPGSDKTRDDIKAFLENTNAAGSARAAASMCVDIIVSKTIQIEYSEELQKGVIILDAVNTDGKAYHYTIIVDNGSLLKRAGPVDSSWNNSVEKAALDTLPSPNPGMKPWHLVGLGGGIQIVVAIERGALVPFGDPIYERHFHNCIHVGLDDEPNSGSFGVNAPPDNFCLGGCNNLLPIQFTY